MNLLLFGFAFSLILCLNNPICPNAIFWAITVIIIDTLYCQSFWFFSHVCQKILEIVPFIAHFNSAAPVVLIEKIAWIRTSLDHCGPGSVSSGWRQAMSCMSMNSFFIFSETSTGKAPSIAQKHSINFFKFPAFASAVPLQGIGASNWNTNGPESNFLTGHIKTC